MTAREERRPAGITDGAGADGGASHSITRGSGNGRDLPPYPDCAAQQAPSGLVHEHGCPVGAAMDAQLAADRAWFDAHPGATHYYRTLMPGDLDAASLACVICPTRVLVRQIAPGVRVRTMLAGLLLDPSSLDAQRFLALTGTTAELVAVADGDPT